VLLQGPWILAAALSAGSCLGIGFLEGYLVTSREGTVDAGTTAGEMVGVMSAVTIGVLIVVVVLVLVTTPPPSTHCYTECGSRSGLVFVACVLALPVAACIAILCTLGGRIGGIASKRTHLARSR
jgi:hypothetical protein